MYLSDDKVTTKKRYTETHNRKFGRQFFKAPRTARPYGNFHGTRGRKPTAKGCTGKDLIEDYIIQRRPVNYSLTFE